MAKRPAVEAPDTDVRDDQVLALREKGTSFSSIARRLELERPSAAIDAFKRAVKQRPAKERAKLQKAEFGRLDDDRGARPQRRHAHPRRGRRQAPDARHAPRQGQRLRSRRPCVVGQLPGAQRRWVERRRPAHAYDPTL